MIIYIMLPVASYMLNIYLSHNNTFASYVYIPLDYSVDEEKYFYLILTHFTLMLSIGSIGVLAMATLLLLFLKHTCGLLKIAR